MAITIVQRSHGVIGPLSLNGDTGTVSFAAPTTAGNAVVAFIWWHYSLRASNIAFPSDEVDNTWNNDPDFVSYDHFPPGWPTNVNPSFNGYLLKALKNTGLHATDGTPPDSMQHFSYTLQQDADTPVTYNVWLFEISGLTENVNPGFGYPAGPFGYVPARVPVDQTVHGDPTPSTIATTPSRPSIGAGKDSISFAGVITDGSSVASVAAPWVLEPIQNGVGVAVAFGVSDGVHAPVFTNSGSSAYALLWNMAGNPYPSPVNPLCAWLSDNRNFPFSPIRHIDSSGIISTPTVTSSDPEFIFNGGIECPWGIALNPAGTFLYLIDECAKVVYQIDTTTFNVVKVAGRGNVPGTLANNWHFHDIYGIACDSRGNIYISDPSDQAIVAVNMQATSQTILGVSIAAGDAAYVVAGTLGSGFSGDGGPATAAQVFNPYGVAFDSADNLVFCDQCNNRIRKVNATTGIINTVVGAGGGSCGTGSYTGDGGPPLAATINSPVGITVDRAGNYYIPDLYNNVIRVVNNQVTTQNLLGTSIAAATIETVLNSVVGATFALWFCAIDNNGNLGFCNVPNFGISCRVWQLTTAGVLSPLAGNGTAGWSGDGGLAISAEIGEAFGIAFCAPAPPATGTITVQKTVISGTPADHTYPFTMRPSWKPLFTLIDGGSDISTVPAGTYSLAEDPVALINEAIAVSNGNPASAIVVAPGDDIVIAVTNTRSVPGPPGGTSFIPKPPIGHGPFQVVPTDNSPNQAWQVSVSVNNKSIPLGVVLRYNEIAKYWVATISDSQGNVLLDSIPLITGDNFTQNILRQFAYLGIGSAAIFNASAKSA